VARQGNELAGCTSQWCRTCPRQCLQLGPSAYIEHPTGWSGRPTCATYIARPAVCPIPLHRSRPGDGTHAGRRGCWVTEARCEGGRGPPMHSI
jgi:hypothetical protein